MNKYHTPFKLPFKASFLALFAMLCLLAACGGGSNNAPVAEAPVPVEPSAPTVTAPLIAPGAYVASLMGRVTEPGKFANWIAPPVMGINRQPVDFDYVRFS